MASLHGLISEYRYVVRGLRRSAGFTVTATAMLAVGIGICTAAFTVMNAALFEGFPLVQRSDRVVYVTTTKDSVYYPDFTEWRAAATSFADIALFRNIYTTIDAGDASLAAHFTTEVTANAFALLGVRPLVGRDFLPEDERPGAAPVAMLRHDLWQDRFGGDAAIVGRSVSINGVPTTVIGVMPRGFSFPSDQDLWTPLKPTLAALRRETPYARYAVARLADGHTLEAAGAEMEAIGARLAAAYPATNGDVRPVLQTFAVWSSGPTGSLLYQAAFGAVLVALLVICANTASLVLGRALDRSHSTAIRLAIGATRAHVVRHILLESLTLAVLGGAAAYWIAALCLRVYAAAQPSGDFERVLRYAIDYQAFGFLIAASVSAGIAVGFTATTALAKQDITQALRGGRGVSRHHGRPTNLLVAAQMMLAVVLLAGSGVLTRSFVNIATADVGVSNANILSMSMYVPPEQYPDSDAQAVFYRQLAERLATIPGVESIGFGTSAPADYLPRSTYEIDGAPESPQTPTAGRFVADTNYFGALGIRAVAGRVFEDGDNSSSLRVAVVNERFASMHWPSTSAVGERVRVLADGIPGPWLTVVGVVTNVVQNDSNRQAFEPLIYLPFAQNPQPNMFTFAKTSVPPASVAGAVRAAVYSIDPALPVPALWPLDERFDRLHARERFTVQTLLAVAAMALAIAAVGLYASMSRAVGNRTHEIGIRAALGATASDIGSLVLRTAAVPVASGVAVGLILSLGLNRVLAPQLVGVQPSDPLTLSVSVAVLVAATLLGCLAPIRRAVRVDPVIALRHD